MKKSDLKHGNVVELKNGNKYLFFDNQSLINLKGIGCRALNNWCEDLTSADGYTEFDIIKVYKDYTLKELLWERKDPKLTEDEKIILRNLPKEYKWIARDIDSRLYIHARKPKKGITMWRPCELPIFSFDHLFQFIKWEDDEPYLIEELLGEEK